MSLSQRLTLCALVVAVGAAAHYALVAHLASGPEGDFVGLRAELNSLPAEFPTHSGTYQGKEHPGRPQLLKQVPFADEVLYRLYAGPSGEGAFLLYAAYSKTGEDRKHHPEVCLREAAGTPEDLAGRAQVPIRAGGGAFAQRFRFQIGTGGFMHLYYWHYTLPRNEEGPRSPLQALHQRLTAAAPSVTFQATTYSGGEELARFEKDVLPAIDAALAAGPLPPGCEVGNGRIPVTFLQR